jgi:hypothetical protein
MTVDKQKEKNGADTVRGKAANRETWACVESNADQIGMVAHVESGCE